MQLHEMRPFLQDAYELNIDAVFSYKLTGEIFKFVL